MVLGKLDRYVQKNETRPPFIPHTRINSKWIKDLNVRPEIMKILEENIGSKILDIAFSNIFLKSVALGKVHKWYRIKLKSFCTTKDITKQKDNTLNRRIFNNRTIGQRGYYPKFIKNSYNSTPKKQTIQFKKW